MNITMKKLFFTTLLLTLFIFTASAQNIKLGVKTSLSFNKIFCDEIPTQSSETGQTLFRFGTQSGVYGAYAINDKLQLGAEILYGYQGYRTPGNHRHLSMTLKYINIPIMAKYYVANRFAVEAGPQFSYCMKGDYVSYYAGQNTQIEVQSDKYNKYDLGIVAGMSYDMEYLTVWARYGLGLTNIFKEGHAENTSDAEMAEYHYYYPANARNSVISIGLAYRILR
jgi:hypothetical protein